ncbi:Monocarboxylate transporter 12 [Lamellibrachia satsuma]|nr:Monocarboxylate transporter 12 [Lamellibrachia satsuma]
MRAYLYSGCIINHPHGSKLKMLHWLGPRRSTICIHIQECQRRDRRSMKSAETRSRGHPAEEKIVVVDPVNRRRAPDGGWGWMCVFGCTFMHFLIGGYGRSYGLIYLQLRSHFNSSAALTAWVGGACIAIRMGCSPMSNALSRRFSARVVVFAGGLIVGTGCVLNAFATSTEYMIFSYSLMAGFGGSLVYSPALVVVGEYFEKRRGVAVGMATAGTGVGAFVGPPLLVFLFERYGFFSALLIVGAIMYNCCVSGALYRPLEDNLPKHATSPRLKLSSGSPEPGGQTSGRDGRGDAMVLRGDDGCSAETTKEAAPLNGLVSDRNCSNWSSRLWRAVGAVGRLLGVSLWTDWRFALFASSQAIFVMSFIPVSMLAPAVAKHNGLSETQAAFVLSAMASGDIVGRLLSGFVFDLKLVRRHIYRPFSAAMLITALAILAWPFLVSFVAVIFNAIICGVFGGVIVAQRTSMVCDLLGADRLSSTLGMLVAAQGVGVFVGPFIAGWCRDYFGNYKVSFIFMAVSMSIACVLSYVAGALARQKRTKTERSLDL